MSRKLFRITGHTSSRLIVVLAGVLLFVALSRLDLCLAALKQLGRVLNPLLIGLALAYVLDPLVRFWEAHRLTRRQGVLAACLLALGLTAAALSFFLPRLFSSIKALLGSVPFYFSQLQQLLTWAEERYSFDASPLVVFLGSYVNLLDGALTFVTDHLPQVLSYGRSLAGGLIQFFTGSILAVYILLDKKNLLRQYHKLIWALFSRRTARQLLHLSGTASRMLEGFAGGKLLDCALVGVLCTLAAHLAQIPYGALLSLVVGVTNFVPVLGPLAGGLFCCLLVLVLSPAKALLFALILLVLQQVDSRILAPRILGGSTGLKALWVLMAMLLGYGIAGVPGMILGVPFFATCYALGREALDARLARRGINYKGEPVGTAPDPEAEKELLKEAPPEFREAWAAARSASAFRRSGRDEALEVPLQLEEKTLTDIWGKEGSFAPDFDFSAGEQTQPGPASNTSGAGAPPPQTDGKAGAPSKAPGKDKP